MIFSANTSPWAGREGRVRHLAQAARAAAPRAAAQRQPAHRGHRLAGRLRVTGRGELQLAILIETMRREGYELQVSKPTVVTREVDGEIARADGAAGHRRPGGVHRRGLAAAGVRRGKMMKMDPGGLRPRAPGVRRAVARPDRLPLALPHRYARHRHHQRAVQRLGRLAGRDPVAHQRRHGLRPRGRGDALRDLPPAGARHPVHPARARASTRG